MLVGALEIEVGRPLRVRAALQGEGVGRAGIEPDVEDVLDLLVLLRIVGAEEVGRRPGEPGVGALGADQAQDAGVDLFVVQRLAGLLVDEHGQRRAPGALPADQPVGTGLDHRTDTVLAGGREEGRGVDGVQRPLAQGRGVGRVRVDRRVHADEPLRRVAEDHGGFGAPGVRIGVLHPPARQQGAGLDQLVDDRGVGRAELAGLLALGLQHLEAAEQRHVVVIGAVRIDGLGDLAMAVGQPDQVVVGAVAGGGVDEAGAGVVGDVVAGQQRHGEAVAGVEPGQRMGADHALAVDLLDAAPGGDLGGGPHVLGQLLGDDEAVARLGPRLERQVRLHRLDLIDGVGDVGIVADRPVGRDGPGRGGPDHHLGPTRGVGAFDHREAGPDRRADVVVVLDLGVGQGGALDRAPHHRLGAAIELARGDELVELGDDGRLAGEVHGGVAVRPVAQHAQALELGPLHADPHVGELAALLAELADRHLVLALALGAVLLLDLPLDRQAVAVPAGHVVDVVAEQEARADDEVLEDLVQRVADVDGAVGVGRAVVQHEQRRASLLAGLADRLVEAWPLGPAGQDVRLQLGQAGAHRERRVGQEDGVAIVAGGNGVGGGVVGHESGVQRKVRNRRAERTRRALEQQARRRHAGRLIRDSVRTKVMPRI